MIHLPIVPFNVRINQNPYRITANVFNPSHRVPGLFQASVRHFLKVKKNFSNSENSINPLNFSKILD